MDVAMAISLAVSLWAAVALIIEIRKLIEESRRKRNGDDIG